MRRRYSRNLANEDDTARDSVVIAACTAVSRATGVIRVIVVGAVLGPTFFGNAFQITNSLPNLIYFGFLAGSLFSSLMVPVLVPHIDRCDTKRASSVSGGFLGVAWTLSLFLVPVALLLLPELLHVVQLSSTDPAADQAHNVRILMLLMLPQVFLYAVVGSATAAMNAHRRFALASAAPAVENVGVIAVLGVAGVVFGTGSSEGASQPMGELVLLGAGSTAAVAVHAALQWWGAWRNGVTILPRRGWRDPEVVRVIRRALRSVAQAGLLAMQMLAILVLASRVGGGSLAMHLAFNFYYLPIALVATPVGLALLPRLSRLHHQGATAEFNAAFTDGLRLALFLAVPAAVGYVLLAEPLAQVVAAGEMHTTSGLRMITESVAALSLGLIGQTAFFVSTQAAYARGDTRTPLNSMMVQAAICLTLCSSALFATRDMLLVFLGASYAVAALVGGFHLFRRTTRDHQMSVGPLIGSLGRIVGGSCAMAVPVWLLVHLTDSGSSARTGSIVTVLLGCLLGFATYLVVEAGLRSPELSRLRMATHRHRPSLAGTGGAP